METLAPIYKSIEIQAVITRKDGTIEDLGTICYANRNPILNYAWKIKVLFKKLFKGYHLF